MADVNSHPDNKDELGASGSMKSNFAVLALGLIILLYLVAIDHDEWFHIRPISGVAVALSQAPNHSVSQASRNSAVSNPR